MLILRTKLTLSAILHYCTVFNAGAISVGSRNTQSSCSDMWLFQNVSLWHCSSTATAHHQLAKRDPRSQTLAAKQLLDVAPHVVQLKLPIVSRTHSPCSSECQYGNVFPSEFRKRPESFGVSFAIVSSIIPTACAGGSRDSNAVLSIPHFLQHKKYRFFSLFLHKHFCE